MCCLTDGTMGENLGMPGAAVASVPLGIEDQGKLSCAFPWAVVH